MAIILSIASFINILYVMIYIKMKNGEIESLELYTKSGMGKFGEITNDEKELEDILNRFNEGEKKQNRFIEAIQAIFVYLTPGVLIWITFVSAYDPKTEKAESLIFGVFFFIWMTSVSGISHIFEKRREIAIESTQKSIELIKYKKQNERNIESIDALVKENKELKERFNNGTPATR